MTKEASQRVADALAARGAELFDQIDPNWVMKMPEWGEDGVSWFMENFDISDGCNCVVGRYYGHWEHGSVDLAKLIDPENADVYEPARGWDAESRDALWRVERLLATYGLTIEQGTKLWTYSWEHLNKAWETEIEKRLANR